MRTTDSGPDFVFEAQALAGGARFVAGLDDVGRGPLAGPVTAAAVVFAPDRVPTGLNDSKLLTPARRAALTVEIEAEAVAFAVAHVAVADIDRLNILVASHLAMMRAVAALTPAPDHLLIDGNSLPSDLPCAAEAVIRGDGRCASIAAASILAKQARDRLMVDLAQQHPGYGWERNAGYATAEHRAALRDLGPTPVHRRSFGTVRNILYQDKSASP